MPASTSVAGWYTGGPRPGQVGSAVIAGHIDSYLRAGRVLPAAPAAARVTASTSGRPTARWRCSASTPEHSYPKDHFPTQQVYGPAPDPELRLITCGGTFDPAIGSYLNNVVVYAAQIR